MLTTNRLPTGTEEGTEETKGKFTHLVKSGQIPGLDYPSVNILANSAPAPGAGGGGG